MSSMYRATEQFTLWRDSMTPESMMREWAYYLIGCYCDVPANRRCFEDLARYFSLETPYNQRAIRDNPERTKTAAVYRFISASLDLLLREMEHAGMLMREHAL